MDVKIHRDPSVASGDTVITATFDPGASWHNFVYQLVRFDQPMSGKFQFSYDVRWQCLRQSLLRRLPSAIAIGIEIRGRAIPVAS